MGFQGVYRAIYEYAPQAEGELSISEGDLLYMLDMSSDDGWWKAKQKANTDDGDEPTGLVPHNYVEEAEPVGRARSLYEYTRQTDEELSFPEDAVLDVYDTSDEDWILVGLNKDYGFVPANYIEMEDDAAAPAAPSSPEPPAAPPLPSLPARPPQPPAAVADVSDDEPDTRATASPEAAADSPATHTPAAALAGVMAGRSVAPPPARTTSSPPPMSPQSPVSAESEVRSPTLPARPQSQVSPATEFDSMNMRHRETPQQTEGPGPLKVPGGFHMYNINEMVSVMGKRKKMPTTLGINLGTGVLLIAPERTQDGPTQEWTADKMTHYSREGKHVFMELVRPSKSIDFHAGAKDTAEEIVHALGEIAGAVKAAGLRELIMAGSGHTQKKGTCLYDFMAQGEDEVTVAAGDEVIVIDDTKSEDWWQVRRLKNGKEGVVPSSYVEVTGSVTPPPPSGHGGGGGSGGGGLSTVEQNRLEEIRLTKEAMKAARQEPQQVGPGMPLPERGSSLLAKESGNNSGQRSKRENGRSDSTRTKPKPDSTKVRTWTDRTRSFSVEAQFIGLKDGKINLHKINGVKIAVPIAKMSLEDLEYVEQVTGISLDEDKPLSNVKRSSGSKRAPESRDHGASSSNDKVGASIQPAPQKPEYDWFQFFLDCDIAVGMCERYAQGFNKESMDESVLPDVDAGVLRNLGLREGDILKVMRHLDQKFGRNKKGKEVTDEESGGLFSGPGGVLRNNTRKGRPAPAVQTNNVVDPKAFASPGERSPQPQQPSPQSEEPAPQPAKTTSAGFDDDAWDVKPSKKPEEPPRQQTPVETPAPKQVAAPTGAMQELSLLTAPLQPTKTASSLSPQSTSPAPVLGQPPAQPQQPQPTGATPAFFAANNQQQPRQRPLPPQTSGGQGSLPPPPARPISAPQSAQPSGFAPPPMAPQMTGAFQGRVAPQGQSMEELNQSRLQQQQQQLAMQQQQQQQQAMQQQYPQMTGFPGQQQGPMQAYPTGMPQGQFMQPMMTGMPQQQGPQQFGSIQAQPTGFQGSQMPQQQQQPPFNPQATGVNSFLPPAMEPQRTGMQPMQPQQTGYNQGSMQPLQPQQTGPPPPVRFGVTGNANKLTPQATGRRANLSHATPDNPFGF